jgi:hypothetical protein
MNIVGAIFILQASFVRAAPMVGISCYSSSMSHQKPSSFLGVLLLEYANLASWLSQQAAVVGLDFLTQWNKIMYIV